MGREYSPIGREENSDVILEFSKAQYDLISEMITDIDKKADDLMRTILAVFGAVLAVASTRIIQVESPWSWVGLTGLVVLASGGVIAAVARIPSPLENR